MKVLVTAASRHGSTREIVEWIAEELRAVGIDSDTADIKNVTDVADYDGVVIGSAIYVGQWLTEARDLIDHLSPELQDKHVWLFSSGLADAPAKDANGTPSLKSRMEQTGAQGHRHFPGKLDVLDLSLAERAAIMAARGKYGDNRDPKAIREWAREIGQALVGANV
ncbi:flavodoxin domain-containing protein [Populibacterium corticicola]|jgi:menaquinone-dependent protoporphyrinogen oxidase|uniref:Flavodoxin domain-containing protein n=1 Tax=Populibacterium corticicola TaxID=1812826 RepID=A0ABW5XGW1_9MICO